MLLSDIIIQTICKDGPISFHDFMEMCLYYPALGYYTSVPDKFGTKGDFYTSSYLTPAFGAMIGKQLEEMWNLLGNENFTIVEYGAGTGFLCHDILHYIKNNHSQFYNQLHYCIIEKSPVMQKKEQAHLHEKVSWHNNLSDIGEITGCILSNELLDNFAVHQVVMKDELMEVFVDYKNGFTEILKPAKEELKNYLSELKVKLSKDFRTEINLEATQWIAEIAASLKKGYVITIDYGYPSSELYREYRKEGTLVCYNKHKVNDYPYNNIGKQDITSHVNFSALYHWGLKYGLDCSGFTDQAHFLLALGLEHYFIKNDPIRTEQDNDYKKEAFIKYTLLVDMGSKYKVLIQQKGTPEKELTGLKLS